MSTFVLVHGAWHGGWCWKKVVPLLQAAGHQALGPDLPGHGDDRTPLSNVSFARYLERICGVLDAAREPVILVGHSMAGAVISQAAENRPDKVGVLVYVCAFLLRDGESLRDVAGRGAVNKVTPNLVFSDDRSAMVVRADAAAEAFYGSCSAEDVAWAQSRLVPQATSVWRTPVRLTDARFGRVPRVYIECLRDQAIPISHQREMCAEAGNIEVFSLDTDHSPFLSCPRQLAGLLLQISETAGNK